MIRLPPLSPAGRSELRPRVPVAARQCLGQGTDRVGKSVVPPQSACQTLTLSLVLVL